MSSYQQTVRSNYTGMSDAALMDLWNDRHGLTSEAAVILHNELNDRALLLPENQEDETSLFAAVRSSLEERFSPKQLRKTWKSIIDQKIAGKHEAQIFNRLTNDGISEEEARFMLHELPAATLHRINDADHDRMGALIRLCCGVAVIVITMLALLNDFVRFLGWTLIVISIVQVAIASAAKSRYINLLSELIGSKSKPELCPEG